MSVDRGGSDRHPVTAHRLPPRLANSPGQVGRGAGRHPPRRIHPRPGVQVRGVCRRGLQPDAHPGMRRRAGRPSRRRSQPSGPAIRPPPVAATTSRTVRVGRRPRGRAALCGAWGAAALRGADGSKNTPCILSGPGAEKLQPQPVSADGEGGTIGGRNRSPPRVAGPGGRGEALRLARNAVHLLDERFGSTPPGRPLLRVHQPGAGVQRRGPASGRASSRPRSPRNERRARRPCTGSPRSGRVAEGEDGTPGGKPDPRRPLPPPDTVRGRHRRVPCRGARPHGTHR